MSRSPSPAPWRCSAGCARCPSAAPIRTSSRATTRASGRRRSRSSPGHEWAGEIVKLGPGAEKAGWKVGDRVAGTSHDACGVCQQCVEGRYNLCENYGVMDLHRQYGHNYQGADAEYVVHGVKCVFPLPDAVSFEAGAVIDPASIALHVANRARIAARRHRRPSWAAAPSACSAVTPPGSAARPRHHRRAAGPRVGKGRSTWASRPSTRRQGDPGAAAARDDRGLGVDRVVEAAGVPATLKWALAALRKGGRIAAVGHPHQGRRDRRSRPRALRARAGRLAGLGGRDAACHAARGGRSDASARGHDPRVPAARVRRGLATFRDPTSGAIKIIVKP